MRARQRVVLAGLLLAAAAVAVGPWALRSTLSDPLWRPKLEARWVGAGYLGEEGVIRQQTAYDCGVVCLQMVMADRGVDPGLEWLRATAGTTEAGTSLLGLQRAARALGLEASAWRVSRRDLGRLELPAIAFFDGDHFVVIDHITPEGDLIVRDPSRGRLAYRPARFFRRWSGEVLLLSGDLSNRPQAEEGT